MSLHTRSDRCKLQHQSSIMPIDNVLDHFDWEDDFKQTTKANADFYVGFDPNVETIRISRYAFSWQAELAAIFLRNNKIPCFITNTLTSNILHLEWTQVDLYVRTADADYALAILEENTEEEH